jgi:hypothetical protein
MTLVALMLGGSLGLARTAIGAPHVRVHAASTIDAHASRTGGKLLFEGTLADEAGHPLEGRLVTVTVSLGPQKTPAPMEPCASAARDETLVDRARPGVAWVHTDREGRFCAATRASAEASVAHVEWVGTALVDGVSAEVTADPSRRQVDLQIQGDAVVDLAKKSFPFEVAARIVGDGPGTPASNLLLVLTNEAGTEIAQATTDRAGQARFVVSPARSLGAPGRGELRVDFAGDPSTSAVRRVAEIERRVEVRLSVPLALSGTPPGTLPGADPEDGVSLPIVATTALGTPVSTGIVEASVEGHAVGAVSVQGGHAELVATFAAQGASADIQIRYASDSPWYIPGPEVTVRMPIAGSNPWRRAPLLLASLTVLSWLVLGRARRPTAGVSRATAVSRKQPASGEARVDVLRATADPRTGWTGRVIDAHEGSALAEAEVRVERPGFGGTEVLARARSNDAGRFELRCDAATRGDRLVVSARLHATLHQNLPPFGQVEIALVQRRRAVLDRMVAWARRRGAPFDRSPEPTPGHVARAARGDPGTVAWAEAVERTGFGPGEVDALAEEEVDGIAPKSSRESSRDRAVGEALKTRLRPR